MKELPSNQVDDDDFVDAFPDVVRNNRLDTVEEGKKKNFDIHFEIYFMFIFQFPSRRRLSTSSIRCRLTPGAAAAPPPPTSRPILSRQTRLR